MAPHSSPLAWKIPWMEEPGGLQSMGSLRVGHNWVTSLSLFTFIHWRRKWQPTPVFLPGESQGPGSLVGCPLWGHRVGHDWSDLAAVLNGNLTRIYPYSKIISHKWYYSPNRKITIITEVYRLRYKCQRSGSILRTTLKIRAEYF